MKKHQLLFFATLITILSGCLGPKKINKWVANQYGESVTSNLKMKTDYISIKSDLVSSNQRTSTTKQQTKNFLPLIVYWQFDYINSCLLNPSIPVNTFSSTVQSYANAKGLKQKLNGQKKELSVDTIPSAFAINDRGHMVWLIYGFGWDNITLHPDDKQMVVSYKITKENQEIKKGIVSIANSQKVVQLKYLRSLKNATTDYLSDYDENIKAMSKKVVDKIIMEL